jgi:MarR family transcriptional regulator, organic hydroperoxide resistance regulator
LIYQERGRSLEEHLIERFQTAILALRRGLESEILRDSPITGPQMFVLFYIHVKKKCKITQLAEKLEVKPSAVTVMIDRLEKSGYVKRGDDPVDRRAILVELTEEGKERVALMIRKKNAILSSYLSRLEPQERDSITAMLEKMIKTEIKE